jgi:hypothetical protein
MEMMKNHTRWLCGSLMGVAVLGTVSFGCGSTGADRLVLIFERWDNTGLTQVDQVGATSADVDVVQDICSVGMVMTPEPFTDTRINAVFLNQEASSIRLEQYTIHFDDPRIGLADITWTAGSGGSFGDIVGGRCSNVDKQCADDTDCITVGGTGSCTHTETTISGLLLFDFIAKQHVNLCSDANPTNCVPPGQGEGLTVTFFGSDPNLSWSTAAHYVAVFDDFDNCRISTGGGGA